MTDVTSAKIQQYLHARKISNEDFIGLIQVIGDPRVAYYCARDFQPLKQEWLDILIEVVRISGDAKWAHILSISVETTPEQHRGLFDVICRDKDPRWAFLHAKLMKNLTRKQLTVLFKAVEKGKNDDLITRFLTEIEGFSAEELVEISSSVKSAFY